jgi:poly [ADP-ribose] polymerase
MNYNVDSGLFSTPIGVVTKETVSQARDILVKMDPFAINNAFTKPDYIHLLEDYMMLIPQKIGRKFDPATIFSSRADLLKQNDVLDSLEASITSILNSSAPVPTDVPEEKSIFNVKVELMDDPKEFKRIYDFFLSTKNNSHVSSRYKLKKVYLIEINHMKKAYDPVGTKLGNVMELWHGTKASNILSILKSGLVMPNPRASNFTGAMFGLGLYFSDQSTKSLNYATNYWNGSGDSSKTFMFVADVAMGKAFTPTGASQNLPKPGFDSTYAIGGKSGVSNNEMIVYNLNQCNLKYLCEFE